MRVCPGVSEEPDRSGERGHGTPMGSGRKVLFPVAFIMCSLSASKQRSGRPRVASQGKQRHPGCACPSLHLPGAGMLPVSWGTLPVSCLGSSGTRCHPELACGLALWLSRELYANARLEKQMIPSSLEAFSSASREGVSDPQEQGLNLRQRRKTQDLDGPHGPLQEFLLAAHWPRLLSQPPHLLCPFPPVPSRACLLCPAPVTLRPLCQCLGRAQGLACLSFSATCGTEPTPPPGAPSSCLPQRSCPFI